MKSMDFKKIENALKRSESARFPVCPDLIRSKFQRTSLRLVGKLMRTSPMPLKKINKSPKEDNNKHENKNKAYKEAEKKRYVSENWKKIVREYDEKHVNCIVETDRIEDGYNKNRRRDRRIPKIITENGPKAFQPEIYLSNKIIEDLTTKYRSQLLPLKKPVAPLPEKTEKEKKVTFLEDKLKNGFANAAFVQSPPPLSNNNEKGFENGIVNCGFTSSPILPEDDFRRRVDRPKPICSPTEEFLAELGKTTFSNPIFEYSGICNEGFVQSPEIDRKNFEDTYQIQLDRNSPESAPAGDGGKPQRPDKIPLNRIPEYLNYGNCDVENEMKWYDFMSKMKKKSNRKSIPSDKENVAGKMSKRSQFLRRKSEEIQKENEKCLEEYKRFKRASNDEVTLAEYCQMVGKELKKVEKERKLSPMEEVNQIFEYCLMAQQEKGKGLVDCKVRRSSKRFQRVGSVKLPKTKYGLHPDYLEIGRRPSNLDSRLSKSRNSIWKYGSTSKLPIERESNDAEFNQDFQNRLDSIDLGQKGMDFWVDGFRTNNKKKLDKINKINIHLHALFSAVEHGHVEKARTILESTDVDVNSVNSDNLTPLDVAVLTNHRSLAKMLVAFGAQEGNHFQSPEKLGAHLKNLAAEADRKIQDLNGGLLTPDQNTPPNIENNNRASFSSIISHYPATSVTGCHGGGGDADKELLMWERRAKALKKMLLGFDQTRPPDLPFLAAVDVTGTNSVSIRFQGPEHQDSSICTKFKVQWSEYENFDVIAGEREITDVKCLECSINDLTRGRRYWFRVACGNLKGYGNFRLSTPASVVPSSWRDVQGQDPRFAGRLHQLDELFSDIRNLRPENASEIKDFSDQEKQGETPALQRRNQKKKTTIKQLFTVTGKFQKNLKRGVYLVCLFYHEDKILVTNEDFLPAIEVDETYPSSIYNDMHWFMKVACTWDDVKSLKQDMEKNLTSTTSHFRIKLLQAAQQMQSALCTQDLGQLYFKPIRDSQGTLVFCTVNYCSSPKSISVLNLRWVPISKVQKKVVANEESNVSELLMASLQSQITYHQVSNVKLSRGLYLGYLKMKSSVDLIQIIVPSKTPNVLPHCKIRDNPHVSSDEWEWLKRINSRHKSLENLQSQVKEVRELDSLKGTEHQQIFVEQVANTARRLFSYMDVSLEDAMSHRLYDVEVVDLSPDISFLIIVPPVETSCCVPGQKDILLERGDLMSVPVQVFEMVHLCTYQHEVISRYSRLSCILELDVILAQHSHREAFSSTEVQIAKDRLSKLQELQIQLNGVWKSVRWIMDVITFARDRGTCSNSSYNNLQINSKGMSNSQSSFNKFQNLQTSSLSSGMSNYGVQNIPGVSMKHLLALTKKKESNKKSPNRISKSKCLKENHQYVKCEKRSLLQIPDSPKDPKLLKSNLSRGSWPGPGVENTGNLLESSFSKSEQHLNVVGQEPFTNYYSKYSGSDCSASSHYVTVPSASFSSITSQPCGKSGATDRDIMSNIGNRLPPSKSEDHLLLSQSLRSLKQSKDYREARNRACSVNPTSVSATNSPLLSQKNIYGSNLIATDAGSQLSIANTNTSDSLHSISSDESTAAVVSLPVTTPLRSGAGTGSLGSVSHSASLLSLAKPIISATGSLNSVTNFPKPKIPVTVSLNSLSDKPITRTANPPTSLVPTGSILSGNTIPVNINQKPKNLELSSSLSNVTVSDVINQHISSSLPSFNPGILSNPFNNRQRIQSPVKSPIKTVSPIDTVLGSASTKRSSITAIDPLIEQDIDLLQHPGLPLDSPTSVSSSLTSVSHNTMTSSGSSTNTFSEYPSSIPSSYLTSGGSSRNDTEGEDDAEDLGNGVKVPTPSSGVLQVYAAYETGLAAGTSLKLHVTPRTSAREVVDLVVKKLNMAVVLKGKDGPIYSADKLKNFCLVAVIGARERCLRDDFKPLQLQNPWKKGRLYVRQKQDVLAALEHSSRQSAFL